MPLSRSIDPSRLTDDEPKGIRLMCQNCEVRPAEGEVFPRCKRCKWANYCSRECQLEDWPSHKNDCRSHREARDRYKESGQKREYQLFVEWKDSVRFGPLAMVMLKFFGSHMREELKQNVVKLRLLFDFNLFSFWPCGEPELVPFESLQLQPEFVSAIREQTRSLAAAAANIEAIPVVLSLPSIPDFTYTFAFIQKKHQFHKFIPKHNWATSIEPLSHIELTSSKFDLWKVQRAENWDKQISHLTKQDSFFKLCSYALHMASNKPRNKTCAIQISVESGHGLGSIQQLISFLVASFEIDRPMTIDEEDTLADRIDNSRPEWKAAKESHPRAALMRIIFLCKRTRLSSCMMLPDNQAKTKVFSIEACDRKATEAFAQLRDTIQFPAVQSPPLG